MGGRFDGRSRADDVLAGMSLSGRSVLVTGVNAGIGFETARCLAAHGAHVVLACRDRDKAEATQARIRALHQDAKLTPLALDLASFASIRSAVDALAVERLDVVICNAGLFATSYGETEEGIERTVGVCHFGHFLLVTRLMERLCAARPGRVVVVSSESHRSVPRIDFERFPLGPSNYRPLVAYGQAKLCNVLFANELTRRFAAQGVVANALHPGSMIGTSIFRDSLLAKALAALMRPFTKSIEQGAATSVYCAVHPALEGVGGRYFADCKEKPASAGARDADAAARLWELSEQRVAAG